MGTYFSYPIILLVPQNVKNDQLDKIKQSFTKVLESGYKHPSEAALDKEVMEILKS